MNILMEEALKKSLFDPEWYQRQYNLTFKTPSEAFEDCMRKSVFSEVSPSPNFDSLLYYVHSPDVYESSVAPLEHYITHGEKEGRPRFPLRSTWTPKDSIVCKAEGNSRNGKYAIVLHIFYDDFIGRFGEALLGIDFECDVFITTPLESIAKRAERVFCENKKVKNVFTAISPNKGRNFGPFLVEFGKSLLGYDLFCHLHSKKSLYSGKEQMQWANYQIEFLLRDKQLLVKTLNIFEENTRFGIYYPTSFVYMPSWVNHWLKNKQQGRDYLKTLNINDVEEFFPYPVGGMFWARPDALRPILEKEWTYDDFPDEPIAADGTLLHVLERAIPKVAEGLGYRQFFYYPYSGQYTEDKRYIYKNYFGMEGHVKSLTAEAKIVSFDIFDTLVKRDLYEPDYAKYLLPARAGINLIGEEFVEIRNKVEFDLRVQRNFIGDVDIYEIYRELVKRLDLKQGAEELADLEFQIDFEGLHAKDLMVEIVNALASQGKKIYLISDTYYLEQHIRRLLEKVGVVCDYELFISSACQLRKDNGSMWDMVKKELSSMNALKDFIHIGDNVCSDAQNPGDHGISNLHILSPLDKWHALGLPNIREAFSTFKIDSVHKWGALVSQIGSNPFI